MTVGGEVSHRGTRIDQAVVTVRHWPGLRSEYSWLPPHDHLTVTKPHQIGVSFTNHSRVMLETEGRAVELDVTAGAVFATGPRLVTWANVREPTEVVELYPDISLLYAAAQSSQACHLEIEPVSGGRDATVLGIAALLKRAHTGGGYLSDVRASTLALRLAAHLVGHYCGADRVGRHSPGCVDRVLLDRVAQLVEDRLGETLRLEDLAAAAGLSPFHFARTFKASTGMAPHEFVTMRRMERAKSMLLESRLSAAEVAYAVGFSNVSHFRRMLRRCTGFSPSDLRRCMR